MQFLKNAIHILLLLLDPRDAIPYSPVLRNFLEIPVILFLSLYFLRIIITIIRILTHERRIAVELQTN